MQLFYLASTFAVWIIAWCGGGVPERIGVALLVLNYVVAGLLDAFDFGLWLVVNDAVLLAGLVELSRRYRRWWILVAAGVQILILVAHYSYLGDSALESRTDVLYRYLLGIMGLYALGLGTLERWLSRESAGGWPRVRPSQR